MPALPCRPSTRPPSLYSSLSYFFFHFLIQPIPVVFDVWRQHHCQAIFGSKGSGTRPKLHVAQYCGLGLNALVAAAAAKLNWLNYTQVRLRKYRGQGCCGVSWWHGAPSSPARPSVPSVSQHLDCRNCSPIGYTESAYALLPLLRFHSQKSVYLKIRKNKNLFFFSNWVSVKKFFSYCLSNIDFEIWSVIIITPLQTQKARDTTFCRNV